MRATRTLRRDRNPETCRTAKANIDQIDYDILITKGHESQLRKIEGDLVARVHKQRFQNFEVWNWQVAAICVSLMGQDCIVSAQTSTGKTMCYRGAVIANPNKTVLVICSLIALIQDLVQSDKQWKIKSCYICANNLIGNLALIRDIQEGDYQIVYASAEFVSSSNANFRNMMGIRTGQKSTFNKNLELICVDKCHLAYSWAEFWPKYTSLSTLRALFPGVPMLAMSAILPPHVKSYIQSSLGLTRPTQQILGPSTQNNIHLLSRQMKFPQASMKDLDFLIPTTRQILLSGIHKTVVFVDGRTQVHQICSYLLARLPEASARLGML